MTSLFLLNIDQEVVKIVPSKDILELWQDMGINEVDTINATLILSKELVTDMEEVFYVGISDIEDKHAFNLYKILTKETTMTEIRLKGVQLAFDELEGKGYIKDLRPNDESFSGVLTRLLQGTGWSLGYVDSNIPNVTTNLYYLSRLDSIAQIINVTGAELKFKVAISDNQITDKYVEAYVQIGQDTGKRFVYGTNSLEVVAEEDIGGIYTSAVGRGRGEEISSAEDNPSGQAGYGRKITFEDVEWKKSDGHPVDKPKGQEWIEIPEATEMFGYPDGSARNTLLEFPNVTDPEQLIWATYHELLELSRPKVQFKTKVENIGLSHYGDTVTIVRYDINLKYQARIFKVRYNRLNLGASELDIGDVVLESSSKKQARFRKEVSRDLEQVNRDIENTHIIASDGTRVNHGADEPVTKKVNDVWFETLNDGTTRIRVWDGNQWVIQIDTSETTKNADAIAEQQQEIEEARQVADDAVNEINTAVENAGFTSLDDTINNVRDIASGVKSELDIAIENAGFTSLDDTIQNISDIASGVKSELDIAIENAGFTSLDDTLQDLSNITMDAEQSAQQAITDASEAYGLAQTSISEAQTAQENSLTALGKADNALDGVSNLDIRVDDVEAELEVKADNTFMTEDGELITLSNAISFNAHRFSSDMQRIESRVETLAGSINLVVLRDSTKNRYLAPGDVYPNADTRGSASIMRELIDVVPGETLALSKERPPGMTIHWRILFYDDNLTQVGWTAPSEDEILITVPENARKMWVSYPTDGKPQITRGEEFLPYRPNIADQMTTTEMTVFRNEYDEFADKTERRLTSIDSSGGRLDTAELLITQTANGLALKADQTTVNELTGEVESLGTEFDVVAGQVSSKVWMSDIDDIDIGGRNLVIRHNELKDRYITASGNIANNSGHSVMNGYIPVEPSEVLTFSMILSEAQDVSWWRFNWLDSEKILISRKLANATNEPVFQRTVPDNAHFIQVSYPTDSYPQIERGNKATDWTPAPEDTIGRFDYIETEWTQTFDTFSQTVSGIDGRVTEQKQTIDNISSTVYNEHAERISTVEQTAEGLQTTVADKANQSQVTQLANGLSSAVKNFNDLEIGGRNLLVNSDPDYTEGFIIGDGNLWEPPVYNRDIHHSMSGFITLENKDEDDVYTFSKRTSSITDRNWMRIVWISEPGNVYRRDLTQDNVFTTRKPKNTVAVRVSFPSDSRPKVERGNKATDWTPAPEDTDAHFDRIETEWTQTFDAFSQTVTGIDGRVTTQKQTIDSISSTVSGHGGRLTTVEQTASGLQSTVADKASQSQVTQLANGLSSVVKNFNDLEIGGRNLIATSDPDYTEGRIVSTGTLWEPPVYGRNVHHSMSGFISLENKDDDDVYTFSKSTSSLTDNNWFRIVWVSEHGNVYRRDLTEDDVFTTRKPKNTVAVRVSFPSDSQPKLEKGNVATDWTPAPEDTDAKIDHVETEWTQTFDSFSQTVSDDLGSVNTNIQTLENSLSAIIHPTTGRLTIAEQTLDGFRNEVYNQDGSSKITQLATGISSVVTDFNNLEIGGRNLIATSDPDYTEGYSIGTGTLWEPPVYGRRADHTMSGFISLENEEEEDVYTFSKNTSSLSDDNWIRIVWLSKWGNVYRRDLSQDNIFTTTKPYGASQVRVSFPSDSKPKLEKGNKATDWTPAPEDMATMEYTTSQISQLSDNINLRVKEGDVISQINMEANRTLIQSNKLLLDASNVVFTGTAWIPNSVIGDLSADKITSGRLDAGKITVANLDANSITSNKTSFVQSGWNGINSRADINSNRLRFTHTDGTSTEIGSSGIRRVTPSDNRNYHYLISIHTFIYGESSNNARWVQLPDDFKNKSFKVYMALADSMSVANYNRVLQRMVATRHPNHSIDYRNARVPVIAYKSESLGDGVAPNITSVQGMLIAIY